MNEGARELGLFRFWIDIIGPSPHNLNLRNATTRLRARPLSTTRGPRVMGSNNIKGTVTAGGEFRRLLSYFCSVFLL